MCEVFSLCAKVCLLWGVFLCPLGRVPSYFVKNVVAPLGGGVFFDCGCIVWMYIGISSF
jgi:hypothetical protein